MSEHDKPEKPVKSPYDSPERLSVPMDESVANILRELQKSRQAEPSAGLPKVLVQGVERDGDRVSAVHYPDGTSRKFEYTDKGDLVGITQPNGTVWKRNGNTWLSSDNKRFGGNIRVDRDGTYAYEQSPGIITGIDSDGRKFNEEKVLGAADIEQMYYRHLPQLDKDGDGELSQSEAEAGKSLAGRAGYLATALHENFNAVKKFSNDNFGTEKNITSADVYKFSLTVKDQKDKKEGSVFDVDWSLKTVQARGLGIDLKRDMDPMWQNSRLGRSMAYSSDTLATWESAQRMANKSTAWKAGVMGFVDMPLGIMMVAESGLKGGLLGLAGVMAVEGTILYFENEEHASNIRRNRTQMSRTLDGQSYRKYNVHLGAPTWQRK